MGGSAEDPRFDPFANRQVCGGPTVRTEKCPSPRRTHGRRRKRPSPRRTHGSPFVQGGGGPTSEGATPRAGRGGDGERGVDAEDPRSRILAGAHGWASQQEGRTHGSLSMDKGEGAHGCRPSPRRTHGSRAGGPTVTDVGRGPRVRQLAREEDPRFPPARKGGRAHGSPWAAEKDPRFPCRRAHGYESRPGPTVPPASKGGGPTVAPSCKRGGPTGGDTKGRGKKI